jgi:hypothetical protein
MKIFRLFNWPLELFKDAGEAPQEYHDQFSVTEISDELWQQLLQSMREDDGMSGIEMERTITIEGEPDLCPHCGQIGDHYQWHDGVERWIHTTGERVSENQRVRHCVRLADGTWCVDRVN